MRQVDLSVVVAAYNEAKRIEQTLQHISAFLDTFHGNVEIIVVDDGSTDETASVVLRLVRTSLRSVRLVRFERNHGKGAALRAGVAASGGKRVLVTDADLSTPIEDLKVLTLAMDAGAHVAVGSRAVPSSRIRRSQPALRVFLGQAGNRWIRMLAVPGVRDTQCGFKLFEGQVARWLFSQAREQRFSIDVEVLCLARRLGLTIVEVGVTWRHEDDSKVRWWDYLDVLVSVPRIAWHSVATARRRGVLFKPVKVE